MKIVVPLLLLTQSVLGVPTPVGHSESESITHSTDPSDDGRIEDTWGMLPNIDLLDVQNEDYLDAKMDIVTTLFKRMENPATLNDMNMIPIDGGHGANESIVELDTLMGRVTESERDSILENLPIEHDEENNNVVTIDNINTAILKGLKLARADVTEICKSSPFALTQVNYLQAGVDGWINDFTRSVVGDDFFRLHGLPSTVAKTFLGINNYKCNIGSSNLCHITCPEVVERVPDLEECRRVYFFLASVTNLNLVYENVHDALVPAQLNLGMMIPNMVNDFYFVGDSKDERNRKAVTNNLFCMIMYAANMAISTYVPVALPFTELGTSMLHAFRDKLLLAQEEEYGTVDRAGMPPWKKKRVVEWMTDIGYPKSPDMSIDTYIEEAWKINTKYMETQVTKWIERRAVPDRGKLWGYKLSDKTIENVEKAIRRSTGEYWNGFIFPLVRNQGVAKITGKIQSGIQQLGFQTGSLANPLLNSGNLQVAVQETAQTARAQMRESAHQMFGVGVANLDGTTKISNITAMGSFLSVDSDSLAAWQNSGIERSLTQTMKYKTLNLAYRSQKIWISCTKDLIRVKKHDVRTKDAERITDCHADNTGPQNSKACIGPSNEPQEVCYMYRLNDNGNPPVHHIDTPFGIDQLGSKKYGLRTQDIIQSSVLGHQIGDDASLSVLLTLHKTLIEGNTAPAIVDPATPGIFDIPVCETPKSWNGPGTGSAALSLYSSNRVLPCYCGAWGNQTASVWAAMGLPLWGPAQDSGIADRASVWAVERQYRAERCPLELTSKIDDELEKLVALCQLDVRFDRLGAAHLGKSDLCKPVTEQLYNYGIPDVSYLLPIQNRGFLCKLQPWMTETHSEWRSDCEHFKGTTIASVWEEANNAIKHLNCEKLRDNRAAFIRITNQLNGIGLGAMPWMVGMNEKLSDAESVRALCPTVADRPVLNKDELKAAKAQDASLKKVSKAERKADKKEAERLEKQEHDDRYKASSRIKEDQRAQKKREKADIKRRKKEEEEALKRNRKEFDDELKRQDNEEKNARKKEEKEAKRLVQEKADAEWTAQLMQKYEDKKTDRDLKKLEKDMKKKEEGDDN